MHTRTVMMCGTPASTNACATAFEKHADTETKRGDASLPACQQHVAANARERPRVVARQTSRFGAFLCEHVSCVCVSTVHEL